MLMKTRIYQTLFALIAILCVQDVMAQGAYDESKQKPIEDAIIGGAVMRTPFESAAIDEIITDFESEGEEEGTEQGIVSLDNISNTRFDIFPNPATSVFTMVMGKRADYKIVIYDLSGRVIDTAYHREINSVSIDVRDYAPSLYLVHIEGANLNETKKLKVAR